MGKMNSLSRTHAPAPARAEECLATASSRPRRACARREKAVFRGKSGSCGHSEHPREVPRSTLEVPKGSVEVPKRPLERPRRTLEVPRKSLGMPADSVEVARKSVEVARKSVECGKEPLEFAGDSLEPPRNAPELPGSVPPSAKKPSRRTAKHSGIAKNARLFRRSY